MSLAKKIAKNPVVKSLGNLKLAVIAILSLAFACAIGTMVESRFSTSIAQNTIYRSLWFYGILALMGTSVIFATLTRLPWKKRHTGFLTVHLGIVLVLVGSYITMEFGVDANLTLNEGKSGDTLLVNQPKLVIKKADTWYNLKVPFYFEPQIGKILSVIDLEDNDAVVLDQYLPNAKLIEGFEASSKGNAAIKIRLKGSMAEQTMWLSTQNPEMKLGPASFKLVLLDKENNFPKLSQKEEKKQIFIDRIRVMKDGAEDWFIPLSKLKENQEVELKEDLILKFVRYLKRARVKDNKLVDIEEGPENPALEMSISKNGKNIEHHVSFAAFPNFPSRLARSQEKSGLLFYLETAKMQQMRKKGPKMAGNLFEIGIPWNSAEKNEGWKFRVSKASKLRKQGLLKVNQAVATGWMDFKVTAQEIFAKAKKVRIYEARNYPSGKEPDPAAVRVTAYLGGYKYQYYLGVGDGVRLSSGGKPIELRLTYDSIKLPYKIALKDFMMDFNPGTKKPASYKSEVQVVENKQKGEGILISMNNPLKHKGYTFYQSSYAFDAKGNPTISTLSVNQDPGRSTKYAGSLILVLGMIIYFTMKKVNKKLWEQPKKQ